MPSLFIVGNGFDLAYGLESSHNVFKEYLEKRIKVYSTLLQQCKIPGISLRNIYSKGLFSKD